MLRREAEVGRLRRTLWALIALFIGASLPIVAAAQTCGTDYAIREGETLAQIAQRIYGNPGQWTVIFYANQDRLGANESLLAPGLSLRLPCIGAAPQPQLQQAAPAPTPQPTGSESAFIISSMLRRVDFLTADGFSPYTGRSLEGGGMLTQVIGAAMDLIKEDAKGRFDYGISWVNDWAAHLNPLLLTRAFDVGFPWARPDCDSLANLDQSSQFRCQKFFFSDPLYEVVTSLFVRSNSRITTLRNEDIAGSTLCRPAGYPTHELDQGGRNWVRDGKVTLMRPPTSEECFRLLDNASVDGVVEAELVGRSSMTSLGLTNKVRAIDQPIALTTYHALISKAHPHARTILYYINSSLAKLRESGEYDRIIERHLSRFWETQAAAPNAGATSPAQPKAGPLVPAQSSAAGPISKLKDEAAK